MGDLQRCIELMLAEEGSLALGTSGISARVGALGMCGRVGVSAINSTRAGAS